MRETFGKFKVGDKLPARWVNGAGSVLNRFTHDLPLANHRGVSNGAFETRAYDHSHNDFRQIVITGVDDEDAGLYDGVERVWNSEDEEWQDLTDEDQGVIPVAAFAYGDGLKLIEGDHLTCHWHAQGGVLLPINPPLRRQVVANEAIAINTEGSFSIWKWNGSAMEDTGRDLDARLQWTHGNDSMRSLQVGDRAIAHYYVESGVYMIDFQGALAATPIQVYDPLGFPGHPVFANAGGLISGRTVGYNTTDGFTGIENCWILFIDNRGLIAATLPGIHEDYHLGQVSGTATFDDETRPLYLVQRSGKPIFWLYRLNEDWGGTTPDQANCDLMTLPAGVDTNIDVILYSQPPGLFDAMQAGDRILGFEQDGRHYGVIGPC